MLLDVGICEIECRFCCEFMTWTYSLTSTGALDEFCMHRVYKSKFIGVEYNN